MKLEDYFKYYIQGSDHYLIPKDIFDELFNEMENWKEEAKELKKQLEQYQEEVCILDMKTDENIKLQNNWNELKDIVNNTFYKLNGILDRDLLEKQMYIDYGYIRNKMQELEGNNE